jgi:dynein light chain 4
MSQPAASAPAGSTANFPSAPLSSTGTGSSSLSSRDFTPEFLAELKKSFSKNLIKSADMNNELQSEAVDLIVSAIDKQRGNYEAAARQVKEQMDRKFGSSWHCIIGEGFGFQVTYQTKHCLFIFYQGNLAILLFKC